jgi:hypothetical protein
LWHTHPARSFVTMSNRPPVAFDFGWSAAATCQKHFLRLIRKTLETGIKINKWDSSISKKYLSPLK